MAYFELKKPHYLILLGLLICGFVVFKWEALFLPFFWDEAWVYMPAIRTMAEGTPSIIPGSIDADLYTGHPLLFYCLSASWIKLWGYSLFKAHSFPMLISIALLISVFYVAEKWSRSYFVGLIASLLVLVQPIFLTQSSYLLIEVWLGLLFLWSFYFYFNKQWWAFGIVLLMALLSKESAYCLIPCFLILGTIQFFVNGESKKELLKNYGRILLVFCLGFSFFVVQKIKLGWLFFPRHANWITLEEFDYKFHLALEILFQHQGRKVYYLLPIMAVIPGMLFLKYKFNKQNLIQISGVIIFGFGFVLFASINFFSTRYLLGSLPLLFIGCAQLLGSIEHKYFSWAAILIIGVYGYFNIQKSMENKEFSDVELSYTRLLKSQVQMVDYLEKNPTGEQTYAPFLMLINLSNPHSGFVTKKIPNLASDIQDTGNVFFLAEPNEHEAYFDTLVNEGKVMPIYQAKDKQAWVNLYRKPKGSNTDYIP